MSTHSEEPLENASQSAFLMTYGLAVTSTFDLLVSTQFPSHNHQSISISDTWLIKK